MRVRRESGEYRVLLYKEQQLALALALALRMRTRSAIRSSHIIAAFGAASLFFLFFFPVLNLGRFGTEGREHGAHACTGGIGCVEVDPVWKNSTEDGETKIKQN